jgi:hypothetical protein
MERIRTLFEEAEEEEVAEEPTIHKQNFLYSLPADFAISANETTFC